jgi:glycosyltransferase involved in cell wall biosynthesis
MRIALIGSDVLSPHPLAPDLVGRWLAEVMAERHGADVHYFVFAPTLQEDFVVEEPPLTVHKVACPGWIPFALRQHFGPRRRMAEALRALAPDIVHSQYTDWGPCGQDAGLPAVVTVHGMYHRESALYAPWRRLAARYHRHFFWKSLREMKHIISISPYVEEELRPHTDATFWYVPNPINPQFFDLDADRAEPGRFLYVGHLIPRKNIVDLLRAFERAFRLRPDIRLRLVGEAKKTGYLKSLQDYVRGEGLGGAVEFVGQLAQGDTLFDEFERASALVLMARQETAPLVISETMAAAKPVISVRACGMPYMVDDGRTGLLAEPGDVEGFAQRMSDLLDDPERCREMGRRGREKAKREFHPDRVADETMRVYERVIEDW